MPTTAPVFYDQSVKPTRRRPAWEQETRTPQEVFYSVPPADEALEEPLVAPETYGLGRLPYILGALGPTFGQKAGPLFQELAKVFKLKRMFDLPFAYQPNLSNETRDTLRTMGDVVQTQLQQRNLFSSPSIAVSPEFHPSLYASYTPKLWTGDYEVLTLNPGTIGAYMPSVFQEHQLDPVQHAPQLFEGALGNSLLHEIGHALHLRKHPTAPRAEHHGPLWESLVRHLQQGTADQGHSVSPFYVNRFQLPTAGRYSVDTFTPSDYAVGRTMTDEVGEAAILRALEDYLEAARQALAL